MTHTWIQVIRSDNGGEYFRGWPATLSLRKYLPLDCEEIRDKILTQVETKPQISTIM